MGRKIKRVSLDFDWPLHKVWIGYKFFNCTGDCDLLELEEFTEVCRMLAPKEG